MESRSFITCTYQLTLGPAEQCFPYCAGRPIFQMPRDGSQTQMTEGFIAWPQMNVLIF